MRGLHCAKICLACGFKGEDGIQNLPTDYYLCADDFEIEERRAWKKRF